MSSRSELEQPNRPHFSASEVGRYMYCARSWWLRRVIGCVPENQEALRKGVVRHHEHGHGVEVAQQQMIWVRRLVVLAVLLVGVLLLSFALTSGR